MGPALSGAQEQRRCARGRVMQAVFGAVAAGGTLVGDERFEMARIFDLLAPAEAA